MSGRIAALDPRTVARSRWLAKLGAARPAVSLIAADRFADPAGANRACAAAIGHVLVLSTVGRTADETDRIDALFRAHTRLGAISLCAADGSIDGLATRETLWSALGGLEDRYAELAWAVRDFCLRVRAIGYHTSDWQNATGPQRTGRDLATAFASADPGGAHSLDVDSVDAQLFAARLPLAPDLGAANWDAESPPADRFCVYTGITARYDGLKPQPLEMLQGCGQVAFLDAPTQEAHAGRYRGWEIRRLETRAGDPHRAVRFAKINAHRVLPQAQYSLWIDASIGIVCPFPLPRLAGLFLRDTDLCVFRHHVRHSIYEEATACLAAALDDPATIDAQISRYRKEGLPEDSGLIEAPILLRRHTPQMRNLNEAWWAEVARGSRRDQLSLNYVAWKLRVPYAHFPLTLAAANGLFVKFRRRAPATDG